MKKALLFILPFYPCLLFAGARIQMTSASGSSAAYPYGSVHVRHFDTSVTTYTPTANTDAARGTALLSAISALTDNDRIILSAHSFNVGSSGINPGVPFSLEGAGMNQTKLVSSNGSGNAFVLASSSTLSDLTFEHRFADYVNGIYTSGAKNVLIQRVRIYQGTDPVWFDNGSEIRMVGCQILGSIVGVQAFNSSRLEITDSYIEANQANDQVFNTNSDAAILSNTGGTIIARNCYIYAGGGTNSEAVHISNSAPAGQVYLYDCIVVSSGSTSSVDLDNGMSGENLYVSSHTVYDSAKTLGTITPIPLIAVGGGGLSMPSTFTWTLNYGVVGSTISFSTATFYLVNGATWPFVVNVGYDFTGSYPLSVNGTVPRGDPKLGVYSSSWTGNNSNYLQNTSAPALVNGARTWAYWHKTSSPNVIAASWGTTQSNNQLMGATFQSASTWDLYGRGGGTNDVTGATTSVNAISGAWTHVGFAYDGAGKTDLFVKGQLAGMARRTSGN